MTMDLFVPRTEWHAIARLILAARPERCGVDRGAVSTEPTAVVNRRGGEARFQQAALAQAFPDTVLTAG